jgi:RsiW-degrading membrane proteinase PrsW (M82 family)
MQQQIWQSIIIYFGFVAFAGFALWVTADHNFSAIWARPFVIIGVLIGAYLVSTGIASDQ